MKTRMKEFRARAGMTQAELAEAVSVRRETIVHMEKGTYSPSLRLAYQVTQALNTTIDQLFSFDDEK
jgi:putative transcriptional regulator